MSDTSSLQGRTLRWKFDDGPTAGATYEHTFEDDGSVTFWKLGDEKAGEPTREKRHAAYEVAPGVHVVSYLGSSGYTLTVALNLNTGRMYAFASNDKEWYPASGTVEEADEVRKAA